MTRPPSRDKKLRMDPLAKRFERWRRHGDLQALGEVFDALAPRLLPVALHLCGNPADAEDALQEAFVLAMRRAETFDPSRRLEPWLAGFLVNTARNAARREQRRRTEELPDLCAADEGPMAIAERAELVAALRTHVGELPVEQRQVLMLQLQHGLAPAEIAEVLDVPAGTVRMRLHRGLAALRRLMPAGFAAWLFGALPSRGLAAVRQAVLQVGKAEAAAAGTTAAAAGAIGGLLAMKKSIVALFALLLLGVLWWSPWTPQQSGLSASPVTDHPASDSARIAAAAARPDDTSPTTTLSERTIVADVLGSLRIRAGARMSDGSVVPMGGALLQVWPGEQAIAPFEGLVHLVTTDATGSVLLSRLAPGTWQARLVADRDGEPRAVHVDAEAEAALDLSLPFVGTAHGVVVDADGVPVPGAELWVHRGTYHGRYSIPERLELFSRQAGISDAEGRFTVTLAPMESRIAASCPGHGESLGRYVTTGEGDLRLVLGRESAELSGTVRDYDGRFATNVLVHLTPPGQDSRRAADGTLLAGRVDRLTHADPQGRFTFTSLVPGKQRIWASSAGSSAVRELEVAACQHPELDLQLSNNVIVTGTVRYADGSPARVSVRSTPDPDLNGHYCQCDTREDGSYYLHCQKPGRSFFVVVGAHMQAIAQREFSHPEAGTIRCDFVLDQLVMVHGRLMDQDDNPMDDWKVVAKDGRDHMAYGYTDQAGAFRIGVAQDQPFTLMAFAQDGREDAPAVVHSVPRADGQAIELSVPRPAMPNARVRGRLAGPDRAGLAGRKLAIRLSDGRRMLRPGFKTSVSADDGQFAIDGLSPGAFDLVLATQNNLGPALANFTLAVGQQLDLGEIVIQPPAVLQVEVTRADGSAWHGAWPFAVLYDAAGRQVAFQPSHSDAGIRLLAAAGSYRVEMTGADLIATPQQVELQAGECKTLRFAVGIGRTRDLVFNGDGKDKPDRSTRLHVLVRAADGTKTIERDTGDNDLDWSLMGFHYWNVSQVFTLGRYEVEASYDADHRYRASFEVRENLEDPTRIDVPLAGQ